MAPATKMNPTRHNTLDTPAAPVVKGTQKQVKVCLGGLAGRLQAVADARGTSMSHIVRAALMSHLDDLPTQAEEPAAPHACTGAGARKKMLVSFTPAQALTLTARARAAVLPRGEYLASLMDGVPPPADSAGLIRALMSVADRLAAFSVDLSRFARHLEDVGSSELRGLPMALDTMRRETRVHMVLVSETLQQLTHTRTKR